jgi:hypothetical protein
MLLEVDFDGRSLFNCAVAVSECRVSNSVNISE